MNELKLRLNGESCHLPAGASVADVVATLNRSAEGIAVARNGEVVPRSEWATTELRSGDHVEVVAMAAGG